MIHLYDVHKRHTLDPKMQIVESKSTEKDIPCNLQKRDGNGILTSDKINLKTKIFTIGKDILEW